MISLPSHPLLHVDLWLRSGVNIAVFACAYAYARLCVCVCVCVCVRGRGDTQWSQSSPSNVFVKCLLRPHAQDVGWVMVRGGYSVSFTDTSCLPHVRTQRLANRVVGPKKTTFSCTKVVVM